MPYCPQCGVEVESNNCPLCSYIIKQDIHKVPFSHSVDSEQKKLDLPKSIKVEIFNISTIFFAVLVSSICLTIDLLLDKSINWSIYPITTVITMALITTVSLYTKGLIKIGLILLLSLALLFVLDIFIPVKNFFLMISLPISISASVLSFTVIIITKKSGAHGFNLAGYILIAIAIFNVFVDLIIQNFIYGEMHITWSIIPFASLTPIAMFLLYIHFVFSKRVDLNKVFHT
ncbi:MAG: hypothetical protein OCD02_07615 [Spirochaetaceae bacterium]